jgi:F0F1-type ATP synthase assembly protein I
VARAVAAAIVIVVLYLADENPETRNWLLVIGITVVGFGAAFLLARRLR